MSISTAPVVLSSTDAGVLTLTLNRPEVLNGLTDDVLDAITDGCRQAASDDGIRVVVISGAGRGFCSGQDLRAGLESGDVDIRGHLRDHYVPMVRAMRDLEKPVIASVNGVAAGAGMSVALAADFRIAAESATFIQAFVRIGLVPDAGSSYFLPRLVGTAKALELAMLGETVDSAEALRLGLVHRVVPDADLGQATADFAARLTRAPRSAGLIKQLISHSLDSDLDEQLRREEEAQVLASESEDFAAGINGFITKRPPVFTGR
ncbi:MAG: enoyl-CoA hydratase/isomerase family protein [Candidatus Dormibacteraeota bacterium]|uniref:Enoyl-CoA hydratase/isomerase family protein n=1 Tax=Candidatus Aeolococcus gillhamiae TaxID=3127015 RepID=A0A934K1B7_9BACT|nr:enoyl-CoA hydratase/isomerase family protein [Candidatus Dormibacteraeota bacterium]